MGFGPAGYMATIYAARGGLSPRVIAGAVTAGGALMNTTEVENFPGFTDGMQGPDLMENLRQQAERSGAVIEDDDRYRQAITAAGSGCAAALDAERYLAALEDAPSIATALIEENAHV